MTLTFRLSTTYLPRDFRPSPRRHLTTLSTTCSNPSSHLAKTTTPHENKHIFRTYSLYQLGRFGIIIWSAQIRMQFPRIVIFGGWHWVHIAMENNPFLGTFLDMYLLAVMGIFCFSFFKNYMGKNYQPTCHTFWGALRRRGKREHT